MFAYSLGNDYLLLRQGGTRRAIWPFEAMDVLTALDRTGNFSDYTQGVLDMYFNILQQKDGKDRGCMKNGLTGLMNDGLLLQGHNADYWAGHTWYTNAIDINWFYVWLNGGNREKAEKPLKAQFNYSMTPEYYMCERFADNDPYFIPWLPNASANGRTIRMMLDFYGMQNK